jgi:hypothetical protein
MDDIDTSENKIELYQPVTEASEARLLLSVIDHMEDRVRHIRENLDSHSTVAEIQKIRKLCSFLNYFWQSHMIG